MSVKSIEFSSIDSETHDRWMELALAQAEKAGKLGEVPVGAVLVDSATNTLLSCGFNQPISSHDPSAHAEIVTLRQAAQERQNYRLPGTVLYVTIEPCTMCLGAIMHARVDALVFGAEEPRAGAVASQQKLAEADFFNHRIVCLGGVLEEQCGTLLKDFFKSKRLKNT